uniref:Protein kinase domain-containing protein n=1 Tax=Globodera pallida TaxID=36090 RepID=A0A183CJ41_GLOPA
MDERHFRSRATTVDTEMNGGANGEEDDDSMDIIGDDDLIENKDFDRLTEEEKLLVDEIVALKRLKMEKEHQGFPITSLREINMLLKCGAHANVVNVREVVVGSSMDKIYLVMDYVEHDVKSLIELMKSRGKKWTIPQVKTLIRQLIAGVLYMHEEYVIHRDLKTSNLLLSHQGILKGLGFIGDFGLAREFGDPIKPYTPVVVTLWYRSPELLLGTKLYSTPVDMWSVGCIFAEFLKLDPLFPGRSEIDQMQKIFKEVGTPNEQIWPGCMELPGMKTGVFADTPYNQLRRKFAAELPDDDGYELLNKLLTLNPAKRLDAEHALVSKWFFNDPKPAHPSTFPTWPAKSEQNRRPPNEPVAPRGQQPQRPVGGFTLRFDAPKF